MASMTFAAPTKPKPNNGFGGFASANAGSDDFGDFSAAATIQPKSKAATDYGALEALRAETSVFEKPQAPTVTATPGSVFGSSSTAVTPGSGGVFGGGNMSAPATGPASSGSVFGGSMFMMGASAHGQATGTPSQTQPSMAQSSQSYQPTATPAAIPPPLGVPPSYVAATQTPLGLLDPTLIPPGSPGPASAAELERVKSRRNTFSVSSQDSAPSGAMIPSAYHELIKHVTPENGRYPGMAVAQFLAKSQLNQATLKRIWDKADRDRQGSLTQVQLFNAIGLVAMAQSGQQPTLTDLHASPEYPIPKLQGIAVQPSMPSSQGANDAFGDFAMTSATQAGNAGFGTSATQAGNAGFGTSAIQAGNEGFGSFAASSAASSVVSSLPAMSQKADDGFGGFTSSTSASATAPKDDGFGGFASSTVQSAATPSSHDASDASRDLTASTSSSSMPQSTTSTATQPQQSSGDDFGSFAASTSAADTGAFGSFATSSMQASKPQDSDPYAAFRDLSKGNPTPEPSVSSGVTQGHGDGLGLFNPAAGSNIQHPAHDKTAGDATASQPNHPSMNGAQQADPYAAFAGLNQDATSVQDDDFGDFNSGVAASTAPASEQLFLPSSSFGPEALSMEMDANFGDFAAATSTKQDNHELSFTDLRSTKTSAPEVTPSLSNDDPYAAFRELSEPEPPSTAPALSATANSTSPDEQGASVNPPSTQDAAAADPYAAFRSLSPRLEVQPADEDGGFGSFNTAVTDGGHEETDQPDFGDFNTARPQLPGQMTAPVSSDGFGGFNGQSTAAMNPIASVSTTATDDDFGDFSTCANPAPLDNADMLANSSKPSIETQALSNGYAGVSEAPASSGDDGFAAFASAANVNHVETASASASASVANATASSTTDSDPYAAFADLEPSPSSHTTPAMPSFDAPTDPSPSGNDDGFGDFNTAATDAMPTPLNKSGSDMSFSDLRTSSVSSDVHPMPTMAEASFGDFSSAAQAATSLSADLFGSLTTANGTNLAQSSAMGGSDAPADMAAEFAAFQGSGASMQATDASSAFDTAAPSSGATSIGDIYSAFAELSGGDGKLQAQCDQLVEHLVVELQTCFKWLDKARDAGALEGMLDQPAVVTFLKGAVELVRLANRLTQVQQSTGRQAHKFAGMIQEALPETFRARLDNASQSESTSSTWRCVICQQIITEIDDSEKVERCNNAMHELMGKRYHMTCANFWGRHMDAMLP
eukprot:TRINITY_DN9787_c0_g1_i1.p1 TRINITY_DN9787_c0_g1~~TRINITY_DN9787_c0_g1_i1.p1  ORF type:complete len:1298 (+),score=280.85 TRINITY_DN9787_c0_g1_i1:228-3896(+)